jgi:hypothetical protein
MLAFVADRFTVVQRSDHVTLPEPDMPCYSIEGVVPVIGPSAYVHPTAVLIGDVIVGPNCYVGPCACLRGDFGRIVLKARANVQDTCVMHEALPLQRSPDVDWDKEIEADLVATGLRDTGPEMCFLSAAARVFLSS